MPTNIEPERHHETSEPTTAVPEWALVTGASSRGGAAIARALHSRGLSVVIHHTHRSTSKAEALQIELEVIRPGSTRLWCADFTEFNFSVPPWLPTQGISVVVANASAYSPDTTTSVSIDDRKMTASLEIGTRIALHVQANYTILFALRPSTSPSAPPPSLRSVVAIGDISIERPPKGYLGYLTAKGALQTMMLALSTDWAPYVRFNVVSPGTLPFPPDWDDEERKKKIMESIPLGRIGSFEELASAVVYLALDATYVTGQVLAVDGGRSRQMH